MDPFLFYSTYFILGLGFMFALMAIGAHHYTNGPSREQEQKQRIKFIILSVLLIASAIFLGRYAAGLLF